VRIRETRIHDWITTIDPGEIWTVNCPGRILTFQDREDGGGKYFDLATHKIPIREILTRSESSDHGEIRTVGSSRRADCNFGSSLSGEMGCADAQTPEARNREILKSRSSESG
jgi:hypothetical protein